MLTNLKVIKLKIIFLVWKVVFLTDLRNKKQCLKLCNIPGRMEDFGACLLAGIKLGGRTAGGGTFFIAR